MTTELAKYWTEQIGKHWDKLQENVIRETYAKGLTDAELVAYAMICRKLNLDPIAKQIYAIKRKGKKYENGKWEDTSTLTIQTSIDGYRLIAERTGKYAPGKDTEFLYDENKKLLGAKVYIKKLTCDGTWHDVSATAMLCEYVQEFKDKKTEEIKASGLWSKMPHVMIEKCAEARVLRRSFPAELSAVYTHEEMQQADITIIEPQEKNNDSKLTEKKITPLITEQIEEKSESLTDQQIHEIHLAVGEQIHLLDSIVKKYGKKLSQIESEHFDYIIQRIKELKEKK